MTALHTNSENTDENRNTGLLQKQLTWSTEHRQRAAQSRDSAASQQPKQGVTGKQRALEKVLEGEGNTCGANNSSLCLRGECFQVRPCLPASVSAFSLSTFN